MQINELLWTSVRLARSEAEVAWGSSCPSSGLLLVSDHRVLLVSDVQAVLQPMVPAAHKRHPELLAWPRGRIKPGAGLILTGSRFALGSADVPPARNSSPATWGQQ